MFNIISKTQALKIILTLLTIVIVFHILIIIRIIPYQIVWAGKLESVNKMFVFETVSISVNILLLTVLLLKGNFIGTQ
jgi:succinate dehydrogenase/fumarate reductase cytochrome b subunit